jgi:hypothetical protein
MRGQSANRIRGVAALAVVQLVLVTCNRGSPTAPVAAVEPLGVAGAWQANFGAVLTFAIDESPSAISGGPLTGAGRLAFTDGHCDFLVYGYYAPGRLGPDPELILSWGPEFGRPQCGGVYRGHSAGPGYAGALDVDYTSDAGGPRIAIHTALALARP